MSGSITNVTFVDATGLNTSTIAVPTGINAGDTLILAQMISSNTVTVSSLPTGFAAVTGNGATESTGPSTLFLSTKTAVGNESGSFVTTFSATPRCISVCLNVTNVSGGVDVTNAADLFIASTTGPFNLASGSTTTTGTGRFAVYLGLTLDSAVSQTLSFTAPSGFTLASGGTYDSGAARGIMVAYAEVPSITTATYTGSITGTAAAGRSSAGATVCLIETQSGGNAGLSGTLTAALTATLTGVP